MRWVKLSSTFLFLLLSSGFWFFRSIWTSHPCFHMKALVVYGNQRTTSSELYWALGLRKKDPLWDQTPENIRKRLLTLPWVMRAEARYAWPDTVIMNIAERSPMAIWQKEGKKMIVDYEGKPIANTDPKHFPKLCVITGEKAPQRFESLLVHLPAIKLLGKIKGATFLRSQRWDIYIRPKGKNYDMHIRLPEQNIPPALEALLKFWPYLKNTRLVDLRFAGVLLFYPYVPSQEKEGSAPLEMPKKASKVPPLPSLLMEKKP